MKVSILIPVFNREDIIEETIQSALSQTYNDFEVIIVDNNSEDSTFKKASLFSSDERVQVFRNDQNIGPVNNWLECLRVASGDIIKILWSDDLISADFLEKLVPILKDTQIGFAYTAVRLFNATEGVTLLKEKYYDRYSGRLSSHEFIQSSLRGDGTPVSPGCAIFRKKDVEKNLLKDIPNDYGVDFSQVAIGNDLLLFLLMAKDYKYVYCINEELSFFREHAGSISVSSSGGRLPLYYFYAKAFFVEKYYQSFYRELNAYILLSLIKFYRTNNTPFKKVKDFYNNPAFAKVNFWKFLKMLTYKILFKIKKRYHDSFS